MKHIHPFPARMAPDIALTHIEKLKIGQTVLDPMSGSGMVLSQAAQCGIASIGFDLDPLAHLISRVASTRVNAESIRNKTRELLSLCFDKARTPNEVSLSWIDNDSETQAFIEFWFHPKQQKQLRLLSFHLVAQPFTPNRNVLNVLKIALSRLIVSKEPKASLARDTAHSRPHKTITKNSFNVLEALENSVEHVLSALESYDIKINARAYLGDARKLNRLDGSSVDAIVTSPPYLNAIDYLRGHRLSLVWLGHNIGTLRITRSRVIGAERSDNRSFPGEFNRLVELIELNELPGNHLRMLSRFYRDLNFQLKEAARVLKPDATATYVIGNSTLRGIYIRNSEILKQAATLNGFSITDEQIREIPDKRRYLPVSTDRSNSLANRMRTEHVITLQNAV